MKRTRALIFAVGLLLAILITNGIAVIRDGRRLEQLRSSVLRLHILAESDSEEDQALKLQVRDALLMSGVLDGAEDLADAERLAAENLPEIVSIAESVLRENGYGSSVTAEIADVQFDERTYGDLTMPAGEYRALRVKIGSAEGHNWWCVMYPPLCLPAATDDTIAENKAAEELFTDEELDIMYRPKKYRVRFAIWDKIVRSAELHG